ncbi:aKG-HExxH-type peptide beta-hydroxylase [Sphingomonas sp. CLY1604]|uniref:aKG-HExxH-type peptide beta-hydroxylase n=1 Tax=Sphingomonas sp. CLY1604 TaxID=3457786 RepID=UPI003FD7AC59
MKARAGMICDALGTTANRWYAGLSKHLAESGWTALREIGLDQPSYGTARVLNADPRAPREGLHVDGAGWSRGILLERFDDAMRRRYGAMGLQESADDVGSAGLSAALLAAMELIDRAPGAGDVVRELVWSVSTLRVDDPAYDVSHSDPDVPFSIFVGIHGQVDELSSVRLAESILHETMHLQLSLIEDEVPLVQSSHDLAFSPWQGRLRPTQGLLHGLYVFRVIQDWLTCLLESRSCGTAMAEHANRRHDQIAIECRQLVGLADSGDLTVQGRRLAKALER